MMRRNSIAWRMAAMFAVTAAVVFSGVAYFSYNVLSNSVRNQVRAELAFHHSILLPFISERDTPAEWEAVRKKLDGMAPEVGRVRYWIQCKDPTYRYGGLAERDGLDVNGALPVNDFGFTKDGNPPKIWGVMVRSIPASAGRPALEFAVALDATDYVHTKEEFQRVMQITSALGILLVAMFGYWIAKLGLGPVRKLGEQANALPPKDPRKRLNVENLPTEISELAVSFNNALARREAAWRQLEGFNADTAHELRTPLTNLIGQTQVALANPRSVDEMRDLLASNLEELDRMSNIVNDMLFLSRADNGSRAADLDEVSLKIEACKTAEYLEHLFLDARMTVRIVGDAQARVDRRLFHRALANLLSNCTQYADPDSEVVVLIDTTTEHVRISVSNEGKQIPQDQKPRLFERFYRGDDARTSSGLHHGLGLSIVRAIANMHDGDVFLKSANGINTFGFTLCRDIRQAGA